MLFNSIAFMLFFPLIFTVYWTIPHRYRWFLLLLSSYYFYMSWNAEYAILIGGSTVITYISGLLMSGSLCPEFEGGGVKEIRFLRK